MTTPAHPEIPQNCMYFNVRKTGEVLFRIEFEDEAINEFVAEPSAVIRPIIAAVAEVAWRKESERIYHDYKRYLHLNNEQKTECPKCIIKNNIIQWRKWGESK